MNKAILVGRLTSDPELKKTQGGVSVCRFSVAVNRRFSDANGNRMTDFIDCVAWRQAAEFICNYFAKGRMIGLVGAIQTRGWTDADGRKRYATEVIAHEAYFTESKSDSDGREHSTHSASHQNASQSFDSLPNGADFMPGVSDDDLPF